MAELGDSLQRMGFVQLALLLGFVTSYVPAIGAMFGARGRRRAAGLALGLGAAFVAATDPWVHGALLAAFAVAALGVFAAACWLVARMVTPRSPPLPATGAEAHVPAQQPRHAAVIMLGRRARAPR